MGWDFYGPNGQLAEVANIDGLAVEGDYYPPWDTVAPGSNGWVHVTIDCTVKPSYYGDSFGVYYKQNIVPTSFIPWFGWVTDPSKVSGETANFWVYGAELYINP